MAEEQLVWPIEPPTPTVGDGIKVPLAPGYLRALPPEPTDVELDYLSSQVVKSHTKYWFPDMTGWRVTYGEQGIEHCQQTWIAPSYVVPDANYVDSKQSYRFNFITLSESIRQLLSWNRERYDHYNKFWDSTVNKEDDIAGYHKFYKGVNSYRGLVVTGVEVVPRPDLMDTASDRASVVEGKLPTLGLMSRAILDKDNWSEADAEDLKYLGYVEYMQQQLRVIGKANPDSEAKSWQQRFPRIRSQYWQVNLTWGPDPYVNRYGIRYAKMEVQPSLRMESLKNIPMGVVPTDKNGQPAFDSIDPAFLLKSDNGGTFPDKRPNVTPGTLAKGRSDWMQILSTGFPVREPQITIRLTYPWVSMGDLLLSGPIGNPGQLNTTNTLGTATVSPQQLPKGLYLGCVNKDSFLGYSRGRVLYNSAEVSEATSPITGKIGYRVMHEFLINPNMEWNQTRYTGDYEPHLSPDLFYLKQINPTSVGQNSVFQFTNDDQINPSWKTGFVVQLQGRTGNERVYRVSVDGKYQAVYPYPYKDLNQLLYYGLDKQVYKYADGKVKFDPFDTKEG